MHKLKLHTERALITFLLPEKTWFVKGFYLKCRNLWTAVAVLNATLRGRQTGDVKVPNRH